MFQDFRKINELPIILKAALSDGVPLSPYPDEYIRLTLLPWHGFNLPQDRKKLLDCIAKDNGAWLKGQHGIGPKAYNAILLYLLNT